MSPRTLTSLLACAALPLGLLVTAAPAQAGGDPTTELVGTPAKALGQYADDIDRDVVAAKEAIRYKAALTSAADDQPIADATVVLQRRTASGWADEASATTNSNGRASVLVAVRKNTTYRWGYAGDMVDNWDPAVSGTMKLRAMRDLNAVAKKAGGKVTFHGNVNPGWGHKKVTLYKRVNKGTWHKVQTKRTSGNGSWSYSLSFPPRPGPKWWFYVGLKGGGGFVRSYSSLVRLTTVAGKSAALVQRPLR